MGKPNKRRLDGSPASPADTKESNAAHTFHHPVSAYLLQPAEARSSDFDNRTRTIHADDSTGDDHHDHNHSRADDNR